ncbi:hypothetical protein BX616_001535 [Lobosporangium transversale]|uniref:Uncharacterized protein n=1 Tax=Lobosporangium transversale TaxID=64571 RepID=A0A1Y2GR11_9FUNG|nr:hypothetical protein BCR41DRAFT_43124 [Lobosporangium transversale]KAF9903812.1 hypothetical protein BX616_001535 [Lobosporangium transversale]ORZ19294.1 hypothetical protein BCR41DRAFT_43124 [Lobosporangium transversale]|eukprot:XP_021882462.1 hypothetical protein BCR41DRAFT_43124 [Lobosporangium transversale]
MSLLAALIGCLLVCQPKQRLPDKRNSANKMLKGKVPRWRVEAQSLPYSQYFLAEKKPQDFDHVKFLTWLQPSSLERRELTSEWLDKVIPALQSCSYKELQDSGNRLKREWNSKIASRGIFWSNLAESEKREQEKKERMARLKAGGEERLQAAEKFIIDETKKDFSKEVEESYNYDCNGVWRCVLMLMYLSLVHNRGCHK